MSRHRGREPLLPALLSIAKVLGRAALAFAFSSAIVAYIVLHKGAH